MSSKTIIDTVFIPTLTILIGFCILALKQVSDRDTIGEVFVPGCMHQTPALIALNTTKDGTRTGERISLSEDDWLQSSGK